MMIMMPTKVSKLTFHGPFVFRAVAPKASASDGIGYRLSRRTSAIGLPSLLLRGRWQQRCLLLLLLLLLVSFMTPNAMLQALLVCCSVVYSSAGSSGIAGC